MYRKNKKRIVCNEIDLVFYRKETNSFLPIRKAKLKPGTGKKAKILELKTIHSSFKKQRGFATLRE